MNAFIRLIASAGFALASAPAAAIQPVVFSFDSAPPAGGAYTATDAATGLKITATAWSSPAGSSQFAHAALTLATDGMGVCNSSEPNCTPGNLGSLGNNAGSDMILFSFNGPVGLRTLTIGQFAGAGSNLSIWAGTTPVTANTLPANLGTAIPFTLAAGNKSNVVDVKLSNDFKADYNWIAVSAMLGESSDLAKLRSLTVQLNPQAQPVPEAATWMTMLAGLGLVGFRVSRRTQT